MQDDYVAYLNHQVREEVVNGYLRERLILEEEKAEFHGSLENLKSIITQAGVLQDYLASLLLGDKNLARFFLSIGFNEPPYDWLAANESRRWTPSYPPEVRFNGWTAAGRYKRIVLEVYGRFLFETRQGLEAQEETRALMEEINNDIKSFEEQYDAMSIINFLKSMDVDLIFKKRIMGENFTPKELGAVVNTMNVPRIKKHEEFSGSWPKLPSKSKVEGAAGRLIRDIYKSDTGVIAGLVKR